MTEEVNEIEYSGHIADNDQNMPATKEAQTKEVAKNIFKITRLYHLPLVCSVFFSVLIGSLALFPLRKNFSEGMTTFILIVVILLANFIVSQSVTRMINSQTQKNIKRLQFLADRSAYCKDLIEFALTIDNKFANKFHFSKTTDSR